MSNQYSTLSQAVKELEQRGFTENFRLQADGILQSEGQRLYGPDEFSVLEYHRFEGMTNPGDMSIVFAVKTNDGFRGTCSDAYGTYSIPLNKAMRAKLHAS